MDDPADPVRSDAASDRFAELVRGPSEVLEASLDEACLLIATHARPDLDVEAYRSRLDDLAAACEAPLLAEVTRHLYAVEGFRGNDDDYYDPRNSYLDQVIDRRVGIPITLAVVLLEVGRRLGIPLVGVGMPGHFLVRLEGEPAVYLDPFDGGRLLGWSDCEALFRGVHGPAAPFEPSYLDAVGALDILHRILTNLRQVHLRRQDNASLEWVLRLRALLPGAADQDRADRAGVLAAMARFDDAATVLDELAAESDEEDAAVSLSARARRLRARLN